MNVSKKTEPIRLIADLLQMQPDEVAQHEAVLRGLREEGILSGTRLHWAFDGRVRSPVDAEIHALAYVTQLAHALDDAGYEMRWEAPW